MKYLSILLFFCFWSEEPKNEEILPTRLEITVIDNLGNQVQDAKVMIFKSQDDYINHENEVFSGTTDKKGTVKFKDLEPISYFIDARKGDLSNEGHGAGIEALEEGKLNKVNIVIH